MTVSTDEDALDAADDDDGSRVMDYDSYPRTKLEKFSFHTGTLSHCVGILLLLACGLIVIGSTFAVGEPTSQTTSARQMHRVRKFSVSKQKQNSSCPNGWQEGPNDGKCFMFVNMSSSWEESETSCRNRSGHLASINSDMELQFIQMLCASLAEGCWVGAREFNSSKGLSWKWSDCQVPWNDSNPLLRSLPSTNCSSSVCPSLEKHCILVSNAQGLLHESCAASHPYVCILRKGDKCTQLVNRKEYLIILIAVSCVILMTTLGIVIWLLVYRRKKRKRRSRRLANRSSSMVPLASFRLFTVDDLKVATNNFGIENRLRNAGLGSTFKGVLPDGGVLIAVKKLERPSFQGKKEFLAEMSRIVRLRHPNVVPMVGCCYEHGQRYIVYQYISNGPLDQWLHDPVRRGTLDWRTRMRIAITAAQGVAYLHDQVKPHVVHRDIKASNLLLDENFNAHLMGVGLANFVPWEAAYERTVVGGTHGYLAPEFVYRNELTTKSDVYSFGVLLLELISGRKPAMPVGVVDWQTIFEWATPLVQSQRFIKIMDPGMTTIPAVSQIQKLVDLIYSCTQHVPSMRPRMSYVVHQLQQVDVDAVQEVHQLQEVYPNEIMSNEPAEIPVQSEIIESLF